MKARKLLYIFLLSLSGFAYSQDVGIGTDNPDVSSALDITSTKGGFLIPRMITSERNSIAAPAKGLMIYNTETNCIEVYTGDTGVYDLTKWFNLCWGGSAEKNKSSNGSAVIEGFDCQNGTPPPPVDTTSSTQTLKVLVSKEGSYDIKTVVNGITFAGSGNVAVGNQDIVLTATVAGTPVAGVSTFSINTVPGCRFDRTVK